MSDEQVTISTTDGAMPAFVSRPGDLPKGGVIVVQEAFGVTEHIQEVCRRLRREGWLAIAPALFHREGAPVYDYGDPAAMATTKNLTANSIETDVSATLARLAGENIRRENMAIVGFCMGGTVAFYMATQHALGAAVTFYGAGISGGRFGWPPQFEVASRLRTPWLGLYGDQDQSIPTLDVEELRIAAKSASVPTEVVRYADAGHAFHRDASPERFAPEAAAAAWQRATAWIAEHAGV